MSIVHVEKHSFTGSLWAIGWLFTIGFAHLTFGQGILALIIWPFYLGRILH